MRREFQPRLFFIVCFAVFFAVADTSVRAENRRDLELSRPVRSWEFLPTVGKKAALFGRESGQFEAWIHPRKVLKNFHFLIHADGRVIPAGTLARTLTVRPESSEILYVGDTFSIRELQHQGLIERRTGSGTFVRRIDRTEKFVFGLLIPGLGETEIFEPICQGMARAGERAATLYCGATPPILPEIATTNPGALRILYFSRCDRRLLCSS